MQSSSCDPFQYVHVYRRLYLGVAVHLFRPDPYVRCNALRIVALVDLMMFSVTSSAIMLYECALWIQPYVHAEPIQRLAKWSGEPPVWHRTVIYGV